MALRDLFGGSKAQSPVVEYPLETEEALNRLHGAAPVDEHLHILFDGVTVGGENFVDLYRRCLAHTGTPVTPFNVFHRFQTRRDLLQYFFATLNLPGARAECGTYRGATALLLAHAWKSRRPDFDGSGLYLIDSFVGTSASGEQDLIAVRDGDEVRREPFFAVAQAGLTPELVRGYFGEFPNARICAGWIPEVFAPLADTRWAFRVAGTAEINGYNRDIRADRRPDGTIVLQSNHPLKPFERHVPAFLARWAAEGLSKPVIIHCRKAFDELLPVLAARAEARSTWVQARAARAIGRTCRSMRQTHSAASQTYSRYGSCWLYDRPEIRLLLPWGIIRTANLADLATCPSLSISDLKF